MEIIDIIKYFLIPSFIAYVGYNEKSKASINNRLLKAVSMNDLEKAVKQAKEIQHIQINEVKDDIKRLEKKIDRLLERSLK